MQRVLIVFRELLCAKGGAADRVVLGTALYEAELSTLLAVAYDQLADVISPIDFISALHRTSSWAVLQTILINHPDLIRTAAAYLVDARANANLLRLCALAPHHTMRVRALLLQQRPVNAEALLAVTTAHCHDLPAVLPLLPSGAPVDWEALLRTCSASSACQIVHSLAVNVIFGGIQSFPFGALLALLEAHPSSRLFDLVLCTLLPLPDIPVDIDVQRCIATLANQLPSSRFRELLAVELRKQDLDLFRTGLHILTLIGRESSAASSPISVLNERVRAAILEAIPTRSERLLEYIARDRDMALALRLLEDRSGADLTAWFLSLLRQAVLPIDPIMMRVIDEYSRQCRLGLRSPPSSKALLAFFSPPGTALVQQALALYFILRYNEDIRQTASQQSLAAVAEYPSAMLSAIPSTRIVMHTESYRQGDDFAPIFGPLLGLWMSQGVVSLLPTSVLDVVLPTPVAAADAPVFGTVFGDERARLGARLFSDDASVARTLRSAVSQVDSPAALDAVRWMMLLDADRLALHADVVVESMLPALLAAPAATADRLLADEFVRLWRAMAFVQPALFLQNTLYMLRSKSDAVQMMRYSHDDLVLDPLLVLRCDERALSSPALLPIILDLLLGYLSASRTELRRIARSNAHAAAGRGPISPEDIHTLALTQDAAAVQLLLDIARTAGQQQEDDGAPFTVRDEVRMRICAALHLLFVEQPVLLKLVHFHGYDAELIPMMVDGVPSMRTRNDCMLFFADFLTDVCLDWLPELLSQPQLGKQLFAIHVAAHLARRYPMPRSLDVAQRVLARLRQQPGILRDPPSFIDEAVQSVEIICRAFPLICEEAVMVAIDLAGFPVMKKTSERLAATIAGVVRPPFSN